MTSQTLPSVSYIHLRIVVPWEGQKSLQSYAILSTPNDTKQHPKSQSDLGRPSRDRPMLRRPWLQQQQTRNLSFYKAPKARGEEVKVRFSKEEDPTSFHNNKRVTLARSRGRHLNQIELARRTSAYVAYIYIYATSCDQTCLYMTIASIRNSDTDCCRSGVVT